MPCPFPGMDPYLESPEFWPDFHATFVNYWREAIADQLPSHYEARIDERVSLVEFSAEEEWEPAHVKQIRPDVAVVHASGGAGAATAVADPPLVAPVIVPLIMDLEETRETYIEIRHRPERTLVTVLELLSPTNKAGIGFGEYLRKRNALLRQSVHIVELDLLVGGTRLPTAKPLPKGDYFGLVARSERRPLADVYHWTVRDPLPKVPVPLKAPDADLSIDLGGVFATAYERGRYRQSLRYSEPPAAPLDGPSREWCVQRAKTEAA